MLSIEIKLDIEVLFSSGLTCSQVCNEILRNLQRNCKDELNFHLKKADRSKCPRRRDFNSLFINYSHEKFGDRNSAVMFDKLEERINEFVESDEVLRYSTNFTTSLLRLNFLLVARCFLLVALCSLLFARYSLLFARYSLLFPPNYFVMKLL